MILPMRSALFVPAANAKALAKAPGLAVDAIIIDLEDAVAPSEKDKARAAALKILRISGWKARLRAVRINALDSPQATADVLALTPTGVDALVIPKVESGAMLHHVRSQMARAKQIAGCPPPVLWAMVETPRGVFNLKDIAKTAAQTGVTTLVAGTNDLAKGLGCDGVGERREALRPHLSAIVLAARACGLHVLDGVYNAFADRAGFEAEARQGRRLGFDGKTLIHPAQIALANAIFGPDDAAIKHAKAIVRAFKLKKNATKGVISLDGQMVERLHLYTAQALLDSVRQVPAKTASVKPAPVRKKKS
jgi:citrate lyase subunit beta / citryl-CoA lyase